MTLMHIAPWWLTLLVTVAGLVFVFLGWRNAYQTGRTAHFPWGRRLAMVLLAAAMMLAPAKVAFVERASSNLSIYFVVDGTGSIAAEDYDDGQPRIEGVKHDVVAIAQQFPSARYSVIEFSSQAMQQLPRTTDLRALKSWADVFDRELTDYSQGSDVNRPVEEVTRIFHNAEERHPDDVRLVFYLGDGESTDAKDSSRETQPEFSAWKDYIDGGAVLGYGTAEGGRMKVKRSYDTGTDERYIRDPKTQQDALSKINEENLQAIAEQLGVDYFHRTTPDEAAEVVAGIDQGELEAQLEEGGKPVYSSVIWPFGLALALLLSIDLLSIVPRVRAMGNLEELDQAAIIQERWSRR